MKILKGGLITKQKAIFLLLIILIISTKALADLVEVDVTTLPQIHHSYAGGEHHLVDSVEIPFPNETLNPGDVFRVNVSFEEGKMLRILDAEALYIHLSFSTAGWGNIYLNTCDGNISLEINKFQDMENTSREGQSLAITTLTKEYWFLNTFPYERNKGEIVNGSLLGDFTIEFTVPTVFNDELFTTQTYNVNYARIAAYLSEAYEDKPIMDVIPEPTTVLLLGFGGLALLRRGFHLR
jgi:hypothetical protein